MNHDAQHDQAALDRCGIEGAASSASVRCSKKGGEPDGRTQEQRRQGRRPWKADVGASSRRCSLM